MYCGNKRGGTILIPPNFVTVPKNSLHSQEILSAGISQAVHYL